MSLPVLTRSSTRDLLCKFLQFPAPVVLSLGNNLANIPTGGSAHSSATAPRACLIRTVQGCAATGSWSWARSLLRSVLADGNYRWTLSFRHYIYALSACAGVVDKPGGKETQGAVKFALALVQDLREAGWLEGKQGEDAYVLAMQTCVRAQDAWSALALLDSAQDDGIRQGTALSTAAMQVIA